MNPAAAFAALLFAFGLILWGLPAAIGLALAAVAVIVALLLR